MSRRLVPIALACGVSILALWISSCVKTGSVKEVQPFAGKVSSYETAVIWVTAAQPDLEAHVPSVVKSFSGQLAESKLFPAVSMSEGPATEGDLQLKLVIAKLDEGSAAARSFNMGGEAVITIDVELTDIGEQKAVGKFQVEGNSSRTSETTVGGVNTKWFDNLTNRAIVAAGEQIIEYLEGKQ
jgi:hypothetical protein